MCIYALRMFDRTEDEGDMLDREHGKERGRKAPFEAGLSNLSSSEPIQNLFQPDKHCIFFFPNDDTIHIIYVISDSYLSPIDY